MSSKPYVLAGMLTIAVIVGVGLYMDHSATQSRLQALPPPTPTPTPIPTPSPTPTPIPSVRVIYAIPSDRSYDVRHKQAISNAVLGVQRWYGDQMNGVTFALSGALPQVCSVRELAQHFHGVKGWHRVVDAVQHCDPVENFSEWHTWVIYIDVPVPCGDEETFMLGRGGDGVAILHNGDIQGLEQDGYTPCDNGRWGEWPRGRWEGGMAHELGHAFGLGHPPECDLSPGTCKDQSLMSHGFVNYPDTFLRDEDVGHLKATLSHQKGP